MSQDNQKTLLKNIEIIISLLGRIAFKPETLRNLITEGRRDPEKFINAYNACNGSTTITEIARTTGFRRQNLSPVLNEWAELGILHEVENANRLFYKKLFPV